MKERERERVVCLWIFWKKPAGGRLSWQVTGAHTWRCARAQMGAQLARWQLALRAPHRTALARDGENEVAGEAAAAACFALAGSV